ncbi:hypothetical protein D3C86_1578940 [compost metagenome]
MIGGFTEVMAVGNANERHPMFAGACRGLLDGHGAGGERQARAGVDQRRAAAFMHDAGNGRADGAAGAQVAGVERHARQAVGAEPLAFREDQRTRGAVRHGRVGAGGGQAGRRQMLKFVQIDVSHILPVVRRAPRIIRRGR